MILIVDDDEAIRRSLALMLRQSGFEAVAVSTAAAAVEAVRKDCPEAVLMDMNLGLSTDGRDGIELLRKVKVLAPDSPVILITAWGSIPLAVECLKFGAADFVTKPWRNSDLMAKIKSAISTAKANAAVLPLEEVERRSIKEALARADYNLSKAAELLGITRQALYRRMEKFGLS